jgi:hypothetical protein
MDALFHWAALTPVSILLIINKIKYLHPHPQAIVNIAEYGGVQLHFDN